MLIPSTSTIKTEDFPTEAKWISKLLLPLNQFLTSAISAINGNIVFGENIPCQTINLSFTYGGSSDFPKKIAWNVGLTANGANTVTPVELRVCSALENGSSIAVIPSWSYANGQISLNGLYKISNSGVSAFTAGYVYNIVLRGQP